jgi:hypothetical protein
MVLIAPLMKVRDIARRWTSAHIPVVIEDGDYGEVVHDLQRALSAGGVETQRRPASILVRFPTAVLTRLAGGGLRNLVAEQLAVLKSESVEVALHPADLVVSGRAQDVSRIRSILTEHLTFTRAYLTWSEEAMRFEDELGAIWRELQRAQRGDDLTSLRDRLSGIDQRMRAAELPYEQWEILFREKLIVERGLLALLSGDGKPGDRPRESLTTWIGNVGRTLRGFVTPGRVMEAVEPQRIDGPNSGP